MCPKVHALVFIQRDMLVGPAGASPGESLPAGPRALALGCAGVAVLRNKANFHGRWRRGAPVLRFCGTKPISTGAGTGARRCLWFCETKPISMGADAGARRCCGFAEQSQFPRALAPERAGACSFAKQSQFPRALTPGRAGVSGFCETKPISTGDGTGARRCCGFAEQSQFRRARPPERAGACSLAKQSQFRRGDDAALCGRRGRKIGQRLLCKFVHVFRFFRDQRGRRTLRPCLLSG